MEVSNKNHVCQINKLIEDHNNQMASFSIEKASLEKFNQQITEDHHFEMGNLKKVMFIFLTKKKEIFHSYWNTRKMKLKF